MDIRTQHTHTHTQYMKVQSPMQRVQHFFNHKNYIYKHTHIAFHISRKHEIPNIHSQKKRKDEKCIKQGHKGTTFEAESTTPSPNNTNKNPTLTHFMFSQSIANNKGTTFETEGTNL